MSYKPRGLTFDQFNVGDVFVCQARTVTEADTVNFAGVSGDYNPLHTDEEFGKTTPFGGRIAHGVLALAIATGQANQLGIFEGTTIALMTQTVKYTGAVKFGDTIHLELKVAEKKETSKADRGVVTFDTVVLNQHGKSVIEGQWVLMMKRGQP
jgi:acyl dehydratase